MPFRPRSPQSAPQKWLYSTASLTTTVLQDGMPTETNTPMKNVTSTVNLALEKQLTTSSGRVMVHGEKKQGGHSRCSQQHIISVGLNSDIFLFTFLVFARRSKNAISLASSARSVCIFSRLTNREAIGSSGCASESTCDCNNRGPGSSVQLSSDQWDGVEILQQHAPLLFSASTFSAISRSNCCLEEAALSTELI